MIGQTISHYRILEKLGEGGMGAVYKAEDTKLKRTVALKFLPPELTHDPEAKQRFIHEAQAASALDHPNTCTIHEIAETEEGQIFISMAFYEGETLKQRIEKGPLKIEEAINLGIQIVQGLQKAHEKGIVHRDIKPANILITNEEVAKILDFGLAKLAGQAKLTKTGSTVGTAAYMSPEQAQGLDIDHRTDIWSLGVVLFEMLTGKLPFRGEHEAALLYSIVHEEPAQVLEHRLDIPVGLALTVSRSLKKEPKERYQSMRELIDDLKKVSSPAIRLRKEEKSIVVLPFENLSPDPDQEYFSDGLTEEVISDLSNVHALRVISRSSAMTFKGTKKKIPEIAREVNVQYVLEGGVRKAGNSLRITAQLIDAANDAHVWAEKYSGTLGDVFDIQEKVSRAIVDSLKVKLTPNERAKILDKPIRNVEAYEFYLKANHLIFTFSASAIHQAIQLLQQALDIVGDNALLFSGMAFAYWNLMNVGAGQEEYLDKAEECVQKALAMSPQSPKAHAVLGWINHLTANPRESAFHLRKALAISPGDSLALQGLAALYIALVGKISAGLNVAERLLEVDPLDYIARWLHAAGFFYDGRYELAAEGARKLVSFHPENPYSAFLHGMSLGYFGDCEASCIVFDQLAKGHPDTPFARLGMMAKSAMLRDEISMLLASPPELDQTFRRDPTFCHHLAGIFSLLNDVKRALDWLEQAVNRGFINYPLLAERDPWLASIRGEERFKKLMERVKKEWEEFEV